MTCKKTRHVKRERGIPGEPLETVMARVQARIKRMTKAEGRQSLVRAGIITPDGKLAPPYR